jgi:hypothetical protein
VTNWNKGASMAKVSILPRATNTAVVQKSPRPVSVRTRTHKALELVATRGREVVGTRQILLGGKAWVGDLCEALARPPMRAFGGQPLIVGAVTRDEYALYVPPGGRARMHGANGVPRLITGPYKLSLAPGEHAVLVLGPIQIRAQIVDVQVSAPTLLPAIASAETRSHTRLIGWVALTAAAYATAMAVCSAFTPQPVKMLEHGAMERVHTPVLAKVAAR